MIDEDLTNFPTINTHNGFIDFFKSYFIKDEFPHLNNYKDKSKPTYYERLDFIAEYGYYLPCMDVIDYIKNMQLKWVSIGSGRGYLEHVMKVNDIDVIATDKYPITENRYFNGEFNTVKTYCDVEILDANQAINIYSDRAVIFNWVSYGEPWGYNAIKKLKRGTIVLHIGESFSGCTGDDNFNEFLMFRCSHLKSLPHYNFHNMFDKVDIYRVK